MALWCLCLSQRIVMSGVVHPLGGIAMLRCVAHTSHLRQVKHFLLIGCLGIVLGACVFLWLSMSRPKSSLPHVLMFMATAISAMSFYAMWTGVGVECVPRPPSL